MTVLEVEQESSIVRRTGHLQCPTAARVFVENTYIIITLERSSGSGRNRCSDENIVGFWDIVSEANVVVAVGVT